MMTAGPAWSQFTTLDEYGNAAGTGSFTQNAGTITITGGGADFWGGSDQGVFLWNDTGSQTTTGDFTATVRHVNTTTPAPEWGRDGIIVRATQSPGTPSDNDAHWLVHRKSNGQYLTGRRPTSGAGTYRATDIGNPGVNFNSDANEQSFQTGSVTTVPFFLSAGREGDRLYSGYALDLGGGVAGRWIQHWSTDNPDAISGLQGGAEVVVGLAHQSHPQTISPDTNDINVATFDNWSYAGSYVAGKFGAPSGPTTWQLAGNVSIAPVGGAITGAAFVQEGGVATGETIKWTVSVFSADSFVPLYGLPGSRKNTTQMETADLVPAANFRQADGVTPGLTADIYLNGNGGNSGANLGFIDANEPAGTAVVPYIFWSTANYEFGTPGANLFEAAVPGSFPTAGDGQDNYGVDLHGKIFIPADADRSSLGLPGEQVIFKDGVDDFCYLEVDGTILINDNDWSGTAAIENGGGNVSMLDVSDPKFNDGEWVDFRMVTWEGGGGDTGALYWSALDANGSFGIDEVPGSIGNFSAIPGLAGAKKDPVAMEEADLVPETHFRHQPAAGVAAPEIKTYSYNSATTTLNLSFTSEAGADYALEYTTGFQPASAPAATAKWSVVTGYGAIAGVAGTTSIAPLNTSTLVTPAGLLPDNAASYFRVRRLGVAGAEPGLVADIYMVANGGTLGAWESTLLNPPDGTAILPLIHWSNNAAPPYPGDDGQGENLFSMAVPGSFASGSNQEGYGVNLSGEILIPAKAARTALDVASGINYIAFEDGVDDFCYLEIDGQPLINDNDWTGNTAVDNGGGAISILDVSNPKFDDGEWVPFRMVMWEGGGGDTASLYWSALDTNSSFQRSRLPGTSNPNLTFTGTSQVGSHNSSGPFAPSLPAGTWLVVLRLENTGVSVTKYSSATVAP